MCPSVRVCEGLCFTSHCRLFLLSLPTLLLSLIDVISVFQWYHQCVLWFPNAPSPPSTPKTTKPCPHPIILHIPSVCDSVSLCRGPSGGRGHRGRHFPENLAEEFCAPAASALLTPNRNLKVCRVWSRTWFSDVTAGFSPWTAGGKHPLCLGGLNC